MSYPREDLGRPCDTCPDVATKRINGAVDKYAASWFIGYYCNKCYQKVRRAMREANKLVEKVEKREVIG